MIIINPSITNRYKIKKFFISDIMIIIEAEKPSAGKASEWQKRLNM